MVTREEAIAMLERMLEEVQLTMKEVEERYGMQGTEL